MPVKEDNMSEQELYAGLSDNEKLFFWMEASVYKGCITCWISNFQQRFLQEEGSYKSFLDDVEAFRCEHPEWDAGEGPKEDNLYSYC